MRAVLWHLKNWKVWRNTIPKWDCALQPNGWEARATPGLTGKGGPNPEAGCALVGAADGRGGIVRGSKGLTQPRWGCGSFWHGLPKVASLTSAFAKASACAKATADESAIPRPRDWRTNPSGIFRKVFFTQHERRYLRDLPFLILAPPAWGWSGAAAVRRKDESVETNPNVEFANHVIATEYDTFTEFPPRKNEPKLSPAPGQFWISESAN